MSTTSQKTLFLFFAIIAVLTVLIYRPSLTHIPRSDHFVYLGEVAPEENRASLLFNYYALNRQDLRFGSMRDDLLFRPLVYGILNVQHVLFGYHFPLWQTTGILLHLLVVWWLLQILWKIHAGPCAAAAALFFSVLLANAEAVTWQHVHGYLLANLFLLIALHQVVRLHQTGSLSRGQFIKLFFALLFACFAHESCVVSSLLIALYLLASTRQLRPALAAALPSFIYLAVSLADLLARGLLPSAVSGGPAPSSLLRAIVMAPAALFWWAFTGLFPTLTFSEIAQRTYSYPVFIPIKGYTFEPSLAALWPVALVLGLLAFCAWTLSKTLTATFIKKNARLWLLLAGILFVFAFLICFGRAPQRGFQRILVENGAYAYFFWTISVILVYQSIPFARIRDNAGKNAKVFGAAALAVFILFNAAGVLRLNILRGRQSAVQASLFRSIERLIKDRGMEDGFSFAVDPGSQQHLVKYPINNQTSRQPYNAAEMLFPQYYHREDPTYTLMYNNNTGWQIKNTK